MATAKQMLQGFANAKQIVAQMMSMHQTQWGQVAQHPQIIEGSEVQDTGGGKEAKGTLVVTSRFLVQECLATIWSGNQIYTHSCAFMSATVPTSGLIGRGPKGR